MRAEFIMSANKCEKIAKKFHQKKLDPIELALYE